MSNGFRLDKPITVFLLLSMVSFFADFTYEGARSISGPYLEELGASLVVVSTLSMGETLSYLARLVSGLFAFRYASPKLYWSMVILGYTLNLIVVPLLAFAGEWMAAFALYLAERIGKGLRVPVRDAILSEVGGSLGSGKLFGIHEVLDQAGAVAGAGFIALSLGAFGVKEGILLLSIPAAMAIVLLGVSYTLYPSPSVAVRSERGIGVVLGDSARISLPLALSMILFIHWSTSGYILTQSRGLSIGDVAALYSIAMLVDGLVALPYGWLYDRLKGGSLALLPILSFAATITAIHASPYIFATLWGMAMSGYETIAKAYIADATRREERSLAYGVIYAVMGVAWTLGNIALALILG